MHESPEKKEYEHKEKRCRHRRSMQVLFASFPNTHARVHGELISVQRGSSGDNLAGEVVVHGNHA